MCRGRDAVCSSVEPLKSLRFSNRGRAVTPAAASAAMASRRCLPVLPSADSAEDVLNDLSSFSAEDVLNDLRSFPIAPGAVGLLGLQASPSAELAVLRDS